MKTIRTSLLWISITLCSLSGYAQENKVPLNEPDYNRPKLFNGMPDRIPVTLDKLDELIAMPVGRSTSTFRFAEKSGFQFNGEVVSAASKYNNTMNSVVVRSADFNGATLTISRVVNPDGSIAYRGRIISFKHGDLYELQTVNGQLQLVKKDYYELVNE